MNKKFTLTLTDDEYQTLRKAGMGLMSIMFPYKFQRNPDTKEVTIFTGKPKDLRERIIALFGLDADLTMAE